jgi:hypothetical protein
MLVQPEQFYKDAALSDLTRKVLDNTLSPECSVLHGSLGLPAFKRNNTHYVSDTVLIYSVGNTVVLFDTVSHEKQTLFAYGRGGVGAITVRWMLRLTYFFVTVVVVVVIVLNRRLFSVYLS